MLEHRSIPVRVIHADSLARAGIIGILNLFPEFVVLREELQRSDGSSLDHDCGSTAVVIADFDSALSLSRREPVDGTGLCAVPPVVIVAGPDRERELKCALGNNVKGYLVAGFTVDQLRDGMDIVRRGGRYLCPRAASRLAESISCDALTEREEAVLALIVEGLCNKSIARRLGIALGTVKSHLKTAYSKLSVDSRTQAVVVLERRGLLARANAKDTVWPEQGESPSELVATRPAAHASATIPSPFLRPTLIEA